MPADNVKTGPLWILKVSKYGNNVQLRHTDVVTVRVKHKQNIWDDTVMSFFIEKNTMKILCMAVSVL